MAFGAMRGRWLPAVLAAVLAVASCTGDDEPDGSPSQSSSEGGAETPAPAASYTEIEFAAADGEPLSGRLFGRGEVAVVLSHMGGARYGQDDWLAFAGELADHGFLVLTYQARSGQVDAWQDVLGAAREARDGGAETVVAGGASIGAMKSLHAATQDESGINAVLWLAGVLENSEYEFTEPDVSDMGCPMLIAAGEGDDFGAAEDAELLHEWASDTSELLIVDSELHGTEILSGPDADVAGQLRQAMLDFLDQVASGPAETCH